MLDQDQIDRLFDQDLYGSDGDRIGKVKQVYADGSFMIEDYNRVAYETYGRQIFQPGSIPYFLYPPGL